MSLIDDFAEYCAAPCLNSPDSYLWWAGAGLVNAVMGRGFWTFLRGGNADIDRLHSNLFITLLGISGSGKTAPIDEARRFLALAAVPIGLDEFNVRAAQALVAQTSDPLVRLMPRNLNILLDDKSSKVIRTLLCDIYDVSPRTLGASQYRLCCTLLSGTTPNHIVAIFRRSQDSLTSRLIYVWGDRAVSRPEIPRDEGLEKKITQGISDIESLGGLGQRLLWTPEATETRRAWVEANLASKPCHIDLDGYWARRETTLAKLSCVIATANLRTHELRTGNLLIHREDWELAVQRLTATEALIPQALSADSPNPYHRATQWLIGWIKEQNGRPISTGELRQHMAEHFHPRDVTHVIDDLSDRGIICQRPNPDPALGTEWVHQPVTLLPTSYGMKQILGDTSGQGLRP